MKTQKPTTQPRYASVNALAAIFARDRRTVALRLRDVPHDRMDGQTRLYRVNKVRPLLEPDADAPPELRAEKLRQEIRKLKAMNDVRDGTLIAKQSVIASWHQVLPRMIEILRHNLVTMYPVQVANLDTPTIRIFGRRLLDQTLLELQKLGSYWEPTGSPQPSEPPTTAP